MRVAIVTAGSVGDVMPYLALMRGLKDNGHSPTLVGPGYFAPYAERAGVELRTVAGYAESDVREVMARLVTEPVVEVL
mgnify:CR=1 FL=1